MSYLAIYKVSNMNLKKAIVEHKRLVNTLKNPTRSKLQAEAKRQEKELKKYLLKASKGELDD